MFKELLSSRLIQGGFTFFILVVGGSLFYSWHVHRTTEADFAKSPQMVPPLKTKKGARAAPVNFQTEGIANTLNEQSGTQTSETSEALTNEPDTFDVADVAAGLLRDDMISADTQTSKDVPASPFGYGPYPEIPTDFPFKVTWTKFGKEGELAARVMIKAWNQGDKFVSATTSENGKVYLIYPNTVYVRYGESLAPDGTVSKYIKRAYGPEGLTVPPPGEDFPVHVQVLDFDTTGIDPYEYLSIEK